ncbi:MAG: choice-of-anchor D domain-containing protein, partial [Terriglobales bacterium]
MLLLAGLTFLVGCQGLSAAGSSSQQPTTLSLLNTTLDFGSVAAGSSATLTATATNSGPASVTVSSATISTKYFSLAAPSLPVTVPAGQSATISIKFAPNAPGAFKATLSITSNASNTVPELTLSGTGTAATSGTLTLNPASQDFGSVTVGAKQSQSVTVTNTGSSTVNISQASVSGTGFQLSGITTPLTLNASQGTTFTVAFAPQASGSASGAVTITSDASNSPLTMPLSGTGAAAAGTLASNPASLSFGSVTVGNKQSLSETVTNTGSTSVTISQVAASGVGFSLSGITTPVTLTAGQSAGFTVTFTPAAAGSASGDVTVTSNASNPSLTIPAGGTGVSAGALGANPASLSFGSVTVGNKQSLSETVTNTGSTSVTISQVAASGVGFSLSGITTPVTLTAGQSAGFTVTFTPAAAGSASGSVTVTSNASNPSLTIPLSGTGLAPGALGANPASLSFGSVTVGNKQSISETVTNTGGTSVTISQVAASGTGFSLSGITTPVTLTAGQSAGFTVTF